jgi:hypothetical protein
MDIEEILERDSALKALGHAEARIAELERENEELKRERDRWSESCYYAELDRAEFSKENKALKARVAELEVWESLGRQLGWRLAGDRPDGSQWGVEVKINRNLNRA